ncbi:MAG: hypothetical protein JNL69_09430, partial [Bacteroidia bacterium]|nr:hypothetical protein [Bacteroidia bacterium]
MQSNSRTKNFSLLSDTLKLDSLSLIPGSVQFYLKDGALLDTSFYKIKYVDGIVLFNAQKLKQNSISLDSLSSTYKTFPYLFSEEIKHKDIKNVMPDQLGNVNPFTYKIENKNEDIFKMDGLNKTGSISRGITVGNNQ